MTPRPCPRAAAALAARTLSERARLKAPTKIAHNIFMVRLLPSRLALLGWSYPMLSVLPYWARWSPPRLCSSSFAAPRLRSQCRSGVLASVAVTVVVLNDGRLGPVHVGGPTYTRQSGEVRDSWDPGHQSAQKLARPQPRRSLLRPMPLWIDKVDSYGRSGLRFSGPHLATAPPAAAREPRRKLWNRAEDTW